MCKKMIVYFVVLIVRYAVSLSIFSSDDSRNNTDLSYVYVYDAMKHTKRLHIGKRETERERCVCKKMIVYFVVLIIYV